MVRHLLRLGVIAALTAALGTQAVSAHPAPGAVSAAAACHSIDGFHTANEFGDGPAFGLVFTCDGPASTFKFVPGFSTPQGAVISSGSVSVLGCGYTLGDQNAQDPITCAAPSPIPAKQRIEIDVFSPVTCPAAGFSETLTVDGGATFTVSGHCAEHAGLTVRALRPTSGGGLRETLVCGLDGQDCRESTEVTVGKTYVGGSSATLAEGATKTVRIKLYSTGRALLAKHRTLKATVAVTSVQHLRASDVDSSPTTVRKTVTLKR